MEMYISRPPDWFIIENPISLTTRPFPHTASTVTMQLARILVSSLPMLAGLAAGLTAPRGLPDGNYLGFITPDGDEIHENLDTGVNVTIPLAERRAVDAAPGSPSALARRAELPGGGAGGVGKPVVYCGCL